MSRPRTRVRWYRRLNPELELVLGILLGVLTFFSLAWLGSSLLLAAGCVQ